MFVPEIPYAMCTYDLLERVLWWKYGHNGKRGREGWVLS
jgi:hypothetical protein